MNFTELKTELYARGTEYLSEDTAGVARAERWLNQAYREMLGAHAWPFLEAETSGVPPLTIADLRRIRYVHLTTRKWYYLNFNTEDDLISEGLDLTGTGLPYYYYVKSGNSIRTAPVTTESVTVGYIKRVDPLTGTGVPIFDDEYHNIIVDRAVIKAYQDHGNFEAATALYDEYKAQMLAMAEDYQVNTRDVFYVDPGTPYDG